MSPCNCACSIDSFHRSITRQRPRMDFSPICLQRATPGLCWSCLIRTRAELPRGSDLGDLSVKSGHLWLNWTVNLAGTRSVSLPPPLSSAPPTATGGKIPKKTKQHQGKEWFDMRTVGLWWPHIPGCRFWLHFACCFPLQFQNYPGSPSKCLWSTALLTHSFNKHLLIAGSSVWELEIYWCPNVCTEPKHIAYGAYSPVGKLINKQK